MVLCPSGLPYAHRVETMCLSTSQVELPCTPAPHRLPTPPPPAAPPHPPPHPVPLSREPLGHLTCVCHPSPEVFTPFLLGPPGLLRHMRGPRYHLACL